MNYDGRELEAMSFARNYHKWILREFEPHLGNEVLEVGAGCGHFSSLLLRAGIPRLVAVEPSDNLFPLLESNLADSPNATAVHGDLSVLPSSLKGHFDTVVYVNVLEHISDDHSELLRARELLKPGGMICVFVPALPGLFGTADVRMGHYRRYQKAQLLETVRNAGFTVTKCRYFDVLGILPWWLSFRILKKETLNPTQVSLYDRFAVPVTSRIERALNPPAGKNLLTVATNIHSRRQ